ncbi:TetR/AcrR family transcriptional regulator [Thalassotalea marina]|uniref:TetR family transcriptional regulator n=1 Tax=Thalassotalea marina TaxID=1673741 RepID=A0A919BRF5_9GAMM|nr:TetR/AcrR family transcriptional regulator [Thalassotalea marina]GHG07419.1 TetR family transcriptional regulator [Thalassotalea marina]
MKLSERKRIAIVDAAEQLFCQEGVEATSMVEIALKAEVSKRTLYNHFPNKDDVFYAVLANKQAQLTDVEHFVFDKNVSIEQQLTLIATNEVKLLRSEPFLRIAKMALMQLLKQPELAQQMSAAKVGCMTFLEQFLQDAVNNDILEITDVAFAAKQFIYQLKGFVFYPHLFNFDKLNEQQEQNLIQQTVKMFVANYKKH